MCIWILDLGGKTRLEERTPKFNRLRIGSKGIGKLAGLGISNIMRIETVKNGKKHIFKIDRRQLKQTDKNLEQIKFPLMERITEEENGTTIILKDLLPHVSSIDDEDFRKFLVSEFASRANFHIWVNGEEISFEDISGMERRNIKEFIEGCGEVNGYILIADKPSTLRRHHRKPGIVTTVRKRRVLGPTLFDINSYGHWYRVAESIYGEIEATFLDPEKPESELDEFIISTSRDGFNKNHPKFIKYKEWCERKLIKICRRLEKIQSEERKRRILKSTEFKSLLVKVPFELRKDIEEKVKKMVESITPMLNELPPKNANIVTRSFIKLFETGGIITILEKIEKASEEDVKQLAKHLTSWGIHEINTVVEYIKYRLSVIHKFEKLVENIHTLEYPIIHKLFEKNLWLLNDDYRLYASNRQLKTILQNEINKKFKKHAQDRPDLIVMSLLEKVVVIELKRPAHVINLNDYAQVSIYTTIIKKHSPNTKLVESYLIGNTFDEAIRNPELEKIGIYLLSYSEILQRAKERYKELSFKLMQVNE